MGFTKNALFPNTQKQKGKNKRFLFGKSVQNPLFPVQNHNQNKWDFQQNDSQPIFLPSFDIKTAEFREFGNPNKTAKTEKSAWN